LSTILRHLALLLFAAAVSWWLLFGLPRGAVAIERRPVADRIPIILSPQLDRPEGAPASQTPVRVQQLPPFEEAPSQESDEPLTPFPPETGVPEGPEEVEHHSEHEPEDDGAGAPGPEQDSPQAIMADPELLAQATAEVQGEASQGFTTVLLAAPEDQLTIARFFGEQLVLVPRSAIDPANDSPRYFHLTQTDPPTVTSVASRPPLRAYRRYRDLFAYEYARLPTPLRQLRRSVLARPEIYLFAALIPPREWALVIRRRTEALEQAGVASAEVRSFTLRYLKHPNEGFDFEVEDILLADGTRIRPSATHFQTSKP